MKQITIFIFYFLLISMIDKLFAQRVVISDSLKITNISVSRDNYPLLAIANDTLFRRGYNDLKLVNGFGVLSDTSVNTILTAEGFVEQIGINLPFYKFDTLSSGDWQEINNYPNNPSPRSGHIAAFLNGKMIIWGGSGGSNGGIFDLQNQTWQTISNVNAPTQQNNGNKIFALPIANKFVIWTGDAINSKILDPNTNQWSSMSSVNSFSGISGYTIVCTDHELLFLSVNSNGSIGKKYDIDIDLWSNMSQPNNTTIGSYNTAVWTGNEMIIWGGITPSSIYLNSGYKYDPHTDVWTSISTSNAPTSRAYHSTIWTGNEMIIWGGVGQGGGYVNTGGKYNPTTDSWQPLSTINSPVPRVNPLISWTGSAMAIWGCDTGSSSAECQTGALYNPATDSWKVISDFLSPSARQESTGVWVGDQFLIWGGRDAPGNATKNDFFALTPSVGGLSFDTNTIFYLYKKQ